jgi:hypothetical protein
MGGPCKSAVGQTRTSQLVRTISALLPKADILLAGSALRFYEEVE